MNPFNYNNKIKKTVENHILSAKLEDGSLILFEWMKFNIAYNKNLFGKYKTAIETFKKRKGSCIEQSFLYISMARLADLETYLVFVEKDNEDNDVKHACVSYKDFLIDLSYKTYGINHKLYRIISDEEAIDHFKQINNIKNE